MSNVLTLQFDKQAMLSGPTLLLRPLWALEFGLAEGMVFSQIAFRIMTSDLEHEGREACRSSYTKLQRQLPFYTARWLVEIVKRLAGVGALEVVQTGRVNMFVIGHYKMR